MTETLVLDPSALIQRYVAGPDRQLVAEAMETAVTWCATELARTEVMLALHRVAGQLQLARELWAAARADFDSMVLVPIDDRCLARALEVGAEFGLTTVDAVHLAAVDRLPRPARYATFDRRQIPAALALGFEVLAPTE
jgi:predicted nucleic acid-binding protein